MQHIPQHHRARGRQQLQRRQPIPDFLFSKFKGYNHE